MLEYYNAYQKKTKKTKVEKVEKVENFIIKSSVSKKKI